MSQLELLKKLREATGAGMSDIKKALDEAGGDETKAVDILRKAGQKIAAKKAERATREGQISVKFSADNKKAVMVAVACETDFVSRNDDFKNFVTELNNTLFADDAVDITSTLQAAIGKIGENILLKEKVVMTAPMGKIGGYIHSSGKVGVLIKVAGDAAALAKPETDELIHEVALQVAALSAKYLDPSQIPADVIAKEKEIYTEQLKNEGKPEAMWDKIAQGKLEKFYADVCLLNQPYIKDDKISVGKYLDQMVKKIGADIKIEEFVRISL